MERLARVAAAGFVLVGGLIHLQLWQDGYRGIRYIGPWFIANVAVSALFVVALLARRDVRVGVASVVFSVASLAALVMSRTVGLFGFSEQIWTDASVQATAAEVGAIVAVAVLVAAFWRSPAGMVPLPVRVNQRSRRP